MKSKRNNSPSAQRWRNRQKTSTAIANDIVKRNLKRDKYEQKYIRPSP